MLEERFQFNILKKLIPHIMKVGGSVYLLQNGMYDSPMCGNEFPEKIFSSKPKSADMLST